MTVPFIGPKLKIKRAKLHISELDEEIQLFSAKHPYRFVVEGDPDPAFQRLVFRMCELLPDNVPGCIGDAIHNLRSTLDLMVCELVRLNGGSDKNVYFPVTNSLALSHGENQFLTYKAR